jgi:hypothetical protein
VIRDLGRLQLAARALSFIPSSESRETFNSEGAATVGEESAATALSPDTDCATSGTPQEAPVADWWYVSYRTLEGQKVTQRLSTAQVLNLLDDEDFDPMARASRSLKDDFRPLACFREFENHFLSQATKTVVDESTSQIRKLYKKFDDADRQRQQLGDVEAEPEKVHREPTPTWPMIFYWLATRSLLLTFAFVMLRWLVRGLIQLIQF